MGKWFPDYRTATPEQVRDYKAAQKAQFRNSEYERKAGIREETPWYDRYNGETNRAAAPLSRWQQKWHYQRALGEHNREQGRLQQASDRQDRQQRRQGRSR
jgi:hypothetical protein